MSDIYMARQPIFGKDNKIYGYELLYRKSQNNFYEGTDDDKATASLLDDFFYIEFEELTDGKLGFVNFSRNLLLDEVPLLLPKDKLIVEILERVEVDDQIIEICKNLKEKGYTLAIDDFIFDNKNCLYDELIELVDIIKIEYSSATLAKQIELINKYRSKITFLAERVETREDYELAQNLGYSLFQGYFFSKPVMLNAKRIGTLPDNLISILDDLSTPEPDFELIAEKFKRDIELAYKLLKLVNSVYYGVKYSITSIHHALVQIGAKELVRWINIMIIKDMQNVENMELIKNSLIRGKMLSLLAQAIGRKKDEASYFIVGIFSSINILLNQNMDKIMAKLPIKEEIKKALLGENNELSEALEIIKCFEVFNCSVVESYLEKFGLKRSDFMNIYLEALKWRRQLAD